MSITSLGVTRTFTPEEIRGRLNAILTPLGWTREYTVQTVQNLERRQNGGDNGRETTITAKVHVTCGVTLFGLGAHSGTGWTTITARFRRPGCPDRGSW